MRRSPISSRYQAAARRPEPCATRGGIPHATAELLRIRSGAKFTYVFYPGSAPAMSDVLGGRVPAIVDGLAGPVGTGQLKMLAVAAAQRVKTHPDIPTVAESYPGVIGTGWFALVAPPERRAIS